MNPGTDPDASTTTVFESAADGIVAAAAIATNAAAIPIRGRAVKNAVAAASAIAIANPIGT